MPTSHTLTVDRNVAAPMRDGTILYADVYRPAGPGPYPTLLQRTPYDKANPKLGVSFILRAASAGYAVVVQDVRGRFASEGEFRTFVHERQDGHDTLEWLAALSGHPALKAIVPNVTASNYHDGWAYQGGAFQLGFNLSWTLATLATNAVERAKTADPNVETTWDRLLDAIDDMTNEFQRAPLTGHEILAQYSPFYDDWIAHPTYDDFWAGLDVSRGYERLDVAALNLGGWYDIFLKGTLHNFAGMRERGPAAVRDRQRLLIGPWNHGGMMTGNPIGAHDFGIRSTGAIIDADGIQLRWFDRWLRGEDNGVDGEAPARIFGMGSNRWRDEQEWPLARTNWQEWYLRSEGRANSLRGDGALSR